MLAIPPFGASSNIALWRAKNKPPLEVVVADCRQSRLRNEVFATDFSVLDYVAANPNEKELNGVPIIPFL